MQGEGELEGEWLDKEVQMTRTTESTQTREPRVALMAVYENPSAAERAIEDLKALGLRDDQLGIIQRYRDTDGRLVDSLDTNTGERTGKDAIRDHGEFVRW